MGRPSSVPIGEEFMVGISKEDLLDASKHEQDAKDSMKYLVMYHRKNGVEIKDISIYTAQHPENIRRWLVRAHREGPSGIPRGRSSGRPHNIFLDDRIALVIDISMSPYMHGYEAHMWTVELARRHINKKFKTNYTYSGAYSVLRSLNIVVKTPRPANPKGLSPEEQVEWIKQARVIVMDLYKRGFVPAFLDEIRAVTSSYANRTLGVKGAPTHDVPSNEASYRQLFFGLLSEGSLYCMKADSANSDTFIEFLTRALESHGKIVAFIDNASYHVSNKVEAFAKANIDRLVLLRLPPYTPELNAIELVWIFFKAALRRRSHGVKYDIWRNVFKAVTADEIRPVKMYEWARFARGKESKVRRKWVPLWEFGEDYFVARAKMPDPKIKKGVKIKWGSQEERILSREEWERLPDHIRSSEYAMMNLPYSVLRKLPPGLRSP